MKKPALLIGILITIILILSLVRVTVSNSIATSGTLLGNMQGEIDYYKTQNAILGEKLYSMSSLTNIASKASQLGFVDPDSTFVINGQLPIAQK